MKKVIQILLALFFCIPFAGVNAQVRLPQLVSNGMILQRDVKLNIWGWASKNERITITFNNKKHTTVTSLSGKWLIVLPAMKTGGPYNMTISASNTITLTDILIGDVWLCAGQSNMVLNMERVKEKYPDEIATADYTQIRNFFIPTLSDVTKPHDDLPPGKWTKATGKGLLEFGAVSYFFAKQLYQKYYIPIGIINSSVGGTPIQAWTSADGIKQVPQYNARLKQLNDTAYYNSITHPVKNTIVSTFKQQPDKGTSGAKTWFDPTYIPQGWHPFWLPGYWADQGIKGLNGVVWFRKEIEVPPAMAGKPARLFMGRIVDADYAYVNGVLCGNTTYQYPPRRYNVPAGLLKAGKNIIVIKLINNTGKGGFVPDKSYSLDIGELKIDLRGDWQYKVGQVFDNANLNYPPVFSAQNEPTGLFNTMVAPAINYKIKGFVWYQGEANTDKPQEYKQLLPVLINDWRNKWQQGSLPFVYAQLPNFMDVQYSPSESKWAELRDAQLKALTVPNTGMAVALDAGEWNDIHPLNKKDVGERLALAAEKIAYGDAKVIASGPIYQSAKVEDNKIVLIFSGIGSGLISKNGSELTQFAIAGADKKFIWAKAVIAGNTVIVSSENVPRPLYVRYAWADNPDGANLYNQEGLPASPFRTDE